MNGMKNIFPEAWEQFAAPFPKNERQNLLKLYYDVLCGNDRKQAMEAAVRWRLYEGAVRR